MWSLSKRKAAIQMKRSEGQMLSRQCRLSWNLLTRSVVGLVHTYPLQSAGAVGVTLLLLRRYHSRRWFAVGTQLTRLAMPSLRARVASMRQASGQRD